MTGARMIVATGRMRNVGCGEVKCSLELTVPAEHAPLLESCINDALAKFANTLGGDCIAIEHGGPFAGQQGGQA